MVDPAVLDACGIDSKEYTGFCTRYGYRAYHQPEVPGKRPTPLQRERPPLPRRIRRRALKADTTHIQQGTPRPSALLFVDRFL